MFFGARFSPRSAASSIDEPRRGATAIALLAYATACLVMTGCGEDRHEVYTPNTKPRGLAPSPQAAPADATGVAAAPRSAPKADPYGKVKLGEAQAAAEEAAQEEKPRDYAADLVAAMRGSEACVKPRPASDALPTELMVSLEALVLESGTIVSGSARATLLTPEELECVRRRLVSTAIAGHVKEPPRRVNGTLKLTFKRAEPAQNAANPAPQPAAAPAAAAEQAQPGEQTPPEDVSGTQDAPEAVAPVDPSTIPTPAPSEPAAPSEY